MDGKIGRHRRVDPLQVEAFLAGHPDIAHVRVVGIPDHRLGEVVVACVIPRAGRGVTAMDLRAFSQGKDLRLQDSA